MRELVLRAPAVVAVVIFAVLLVSGVLVVPAAAQLACGGTVGPGGTFTMTSDILNCGANPALSVIGPAVLDMNGHTISCGARPLNGLVLTQTGVTAKNGSITNCTVGVVVRDGGRHSVRSLAVATDEPLLSPFGGGIAFLVTSDRNTLSGDVARNTTFQASTSTITQNGIGFKVQGNSNQLQDDVAANNESGFLVLGSSNILSGNTTADCTDGFAIQSGLGNRLVGNVAARSSEAGFFISGGTRHVLTGNTAVATGNGDNVRETPTGIVVAGDGNNIVQNNTVLANAFGGIEADSSGNTISGNRVLGNVAGDLSDFSDHATFSSCTTNVWRNNIFGTRSLACIH